MNKNDFYTFVTLLLENGIQFELKNFANADGDITSSILLYEQDVEVDMET